MGSPGIVVLGEGAGRQKVVVTHGGNLLRPRDGAVLGHLPWPHEKGPGGSIAVISSSDPAHPGCRIVFRDTTGDSAKAPMTAFRLHPPADDGITVDLVEGEYGPNCGYVHQIATDALLITRHGIFRAGSGERMADGKGSTLGGISGILAGKLLFVAAPGNRNGMLSDWKERREDGKAFTAFTVTDLSDPSKPKELGNDNLLGGAGFPRMPAMERYTKELYDAPWWTCTPWGKPAHRLHADSCATALGNRLFIRTVDRLYCIGDPAVPYDWNPTSKERQP